MRMIGIGANDSDPSYDEPEYWCDKCVGELMEQDLFNEWFCPACEKKEREEREKAKKGGKK